MDTITDNQIQEIGRQLDRSEKILSAARADLKVRPSDKEAIRKYNYWLGHNNGLERIVYILNM